MQVLDLAVLAEFVVDGLLVGLLVDVGHHDDPALDGADGGGAAVGLHVALVAGRRGSRSPSRSPSRSRSLLFLRRFLRRFLLLLLRLVVDIHFYVGHDDGVCGGASRSVCR